MEPLAEKCSVALTVVAIVVLAINHGLVAADTLSVSAGVVSIEDVKLSGLLIPIVAIGTLVGLAICHLRHHAPFLVERFSAGYREAPPIVELVRAQVAAAAEGTKHGAPYGGLRGSLRIQSQDLGKFTKPSGSLSKSVIITPGQNEHREAVWNGIRRLLAKGLWLSVYGPLVLALWALATIAV